ncbi:MAG: hypothetical protein FD138_2021, partial [Planctomycetota bacterium]
MRRKFIGFGFSVVFATVALLRAEVA